MLPRPCLQAFPQSRSELPSLLNCGARRLNRHKVGVQAGVHAHHFLSSWSGKRLRLVDLWGQQAAPDNLFYVDIANVHGNDAKKQHRLQCERRLEESLRSGRAEILNLVLASGLTGIADVALRRLSPGLQHPQARFKVMQQLRDPFS
ncbi:rlmJ [Symbiodinium sp. CCMP2592]|nr:rlmJ [Symbiodinium sp. CCMP2592]